MDKHHLKDTRWRAVVARDAAADGKFFYSVKTTGVYCRPSCAARTPRPENVAFHLTAADAERAGFRACKRCKPGQIRFAVGKCALGSLLVAQSERGVCAILMGDSADALTRDLRERFPQVVQGEVSVAEVARYVEAPARGLELPLDVRGTAFQRRVWQALQKIPAGKTASYAEVAQRIGSPGAVRAVAQACAANPLAVAIPCHRVVRQDGALSGYRWGVARKRALLDREGAPREPR